MENLKNFNVDPKFLEPLKELEKSFGIERDLRSGLMLAADTEQLAGIANMRFDLIDDIMKDGRLDNMLAFEKVYAEGEQLPLVVERVDKIIEGFRIIIDDGGKEYIAKVEEAQSKELWPNDNESLPRDDMRATIRDHFEWTYNRWAHANGWDHADGGEYTSATPLSVMATIESSVCSKRSELGVTIEYHYRGLQNKVLERGTDLTRWHSHDHAQSLSL